MCRTGLGVLGREWVERRLGGTSNGFDGRLCNRKRNGHCGGKPRRALRRARRVNARILSSSRLRAYRLLEQLRVSPLPGAERQLAQGRSQIAVRGRRASRIRLGRCRQLWARRTEARERGIRGALRLPAQPSGRCTRRAEPQQPDHGTRGSPCARAETAEPITHEAGGAALARPRPRSVAVVARLRDDGGGNGSSSTSLGVPAQRLTP